MKRAFGYIRDIGYVPTRLQPMNSLQQLIQTVLEIQSDTAAYDRRVQLQVNKLLEKADTFSNERETI